VQPSILIDEALTPAGEKVTLSTHSGYFEVRVEGHLLMSSAAHHSEEQMAELVCGDGSNAPSLRVLIGGLGLGYTVRAALDRLLPGAEVVVVELIEAVVRWNAGPLAHLAKRPLDDPRVHLEVGDLADYLRRDDLEPFDGILLDVDNGPEAFTLRRNRRFYEQRGLKRLHAALRPGGSLVVWSAFESQTFPATLRRAGFDVSTVRTRSRGKKGTHHVLYVGHRR